VQAYVLIQKQPDGEPIAWALRAIPGVVSAVDVSGAYDAIALVRSGSERGIIEGILREIREIPGVTRALPAPLIHASIEGREAGRLDRPSRRRHEPELARAG
jgi:DNA-binding Lrp family transcriptional regulator